MYSIQDAIELFDANLNSINTSLNLTNTNPNAALIEKKNLYLGLGIIAQSLKNIEIQIKNIGNKIK